MQAAYRLKLFGIEPKVALLSHSNFGSHQDARATKMRRAYEIVRARVPKLEIDGEMMADTAWDEALRQRIMPNTTLSGRANLLVMPNLDAANIGYNLIRVATGGVAIGPIPVSYTHLDVYKRQGDGLDDIQLDHAGASPGNRKTVSQVACAGPWRVVAQAGA